MYDFDLVTAVAKKGQKDPQEYLPFLESLRLLSPARMRYTVDVRLQRWSRALASLAQEPDSLAECLQLVQERRLYAFALASVWTEAGSPARAQCYAAYGSYLEGKGHAAEAGICFARAGELRRELGCAQQLGDWAWAAQRGGAAAGSETGAMLEAQHRWEELARLRAWLLLGQNQSRPDVAEALARAGHYSEAQLWHQPTARALILKLANER